MTPDQIPPETIGLPAQLKIKRTYSYGCVYLIETLWKRLGLEKIFSDIANKKNLRIPYERALLAMTANRLCEADSKTGGLGSLVFQGISSLLPVLAAKTHVRGHGPVL